MNKTFVINQKGHQREGSLMVQLKHLRSPNMPINSFLPGVIVAFGYLNATVLRTRNKFLLYIFRFKLVKTEI